MEESHKLHTQRETQLKGLFIIAYRRCNPLPIQSSSGSIHDPHERQLDMVSALPIPPTPASQVSLLTPKTLPTSPVTPQCLLPLYKEQEL